MAAGRTDVPRARKRPARKAEPAAVWEPPRWLAPALYLTLTSVLFADFIISDRMLLGTDTLALGYFARDFFHRFVLAYREFPLWNPLIFGGLPFKEGLHGDVFYPTTVLLFFQETHRALGWKLVVHVFLAGIFMNMWLRSIGLAGAAALFGGLAYMFAPFFVSLVYPGHDGKMFITALTPLLFYLVERAASRGRIADFAWVGLGVALMIYTPHMQLAYYAVWGFSLWFLFRLHELWRTERQAGVIARRGALFVLAGLLGAAAGGVQLMPPLRYLGEYSHRADKAGDALRGVEYSASWSMHPEEAMGLVIPNFAGSNIGGDDSYWGRNAFKLANEYMGLLPLLLLPLAFVGRRDRRSFLFLLIAALSLVYALGLTTPLFRLFYLIPGVSLFRAPAAIIFLVAFSALTLAAIGLHRLLHWRPEEAESLLARRYLWGAAAALLLLALLASAGALPALWQALVYRDMPARSALTLEQHLGSIQAGFWIAFLLAAGAAGAAELHGRRVVGSRGVVVLLLVLAAMDLGRVNRGYIVTIEPQLQFGADDTVWFLQNRIAQGEVFRVFDLGMLIGGSYPTNYFALHGIEELAGHHGNEIGAYRDFLGGERPARLITAEGGLALRLLNLANVRYVVAQQQLPIPGFEPVHQGRRALIYENAGAFPRGWVVGEVEVVDDARVMDRLLAADFDPARVALLPEPLADDVHLAPGVTGTVQWLDLDPVRPVQGRINRQRLRVTTNGAGLLVLSENYHHGWQATVAGEPVPLLRVNRTFRAVPVTAGSTVVELRYRSAELRAWGLITVIAILLLAGLAAAGWVQVWWRPGAS
jgi:hypothetical protein